MAETRLLDLDPRAYGLAVFRWWHDHADCPGGWCLREEGRCPPPPPLPSWSSCPGFSLHEPRLIECGGCEGCDGSSHVCHLTGEVAPCTQPCGTVAPPGSITLNADRDLFTTLEEHMGRGLEQVLPRREAVERTREIMQAVGLARGLVEAADGDDPRLLLAAFDRFMDVLVNDL